MSRVLLKIRQEFIIKWFYVKYIKKILDKPKTLPFLGALLEINKSMKHGQKHKKFGRDRDQRRALFRALITSLCEHGRIETTLPKAKAIKPMVEKLLTKAKSPVLANIRALSGYVYTELARKNLVDFAKAAENRKGGYTRIYKKGPRLSDASPMAIIEFVDKPETSK